MKVEPDYILCRRFVHVRPNRKYGDSSGRKLARGSLIVKYDRRKFSGQLQLIYLIRICY